MLKLCTEYYYVGMQTDRKIGKFSLNFIDSCENRFDIPQR